MKNLLSKKFSLSFCSVLASGLPLAFVPLTSCSNSNSIQLANFESYMNNDLMDHLQSKFDVQFQWFTVTEMIETKFKKVYDIAVPSGYELVSLYKKGWLEKLDWSQFNVKDQEGNVVKNAGDAMKLFATPIREAIDQMNIGFRSYKDMPQDFNVLDYGVPYFAQSFMFAYKGDEISFYQNGTTSKTSAPTWADIFYTIGPKNPNLDSRFKDRRIGMVDDAKSIYDISRIVETIEQNPNNKNNWTNVMPKGSTISDLTKTFNAVTSKAKQNWYTLNTDSAIISRNLADHQKTSYIGALSWSGDALYGALGAEEFKPYSGKEMHIVKPYGASLDEIEFFVMNNKNHNTPKGKRIYDVIKEVCLDGCDVSSQEIKKQNEDGSYKYWAMENWDTVNYIPILNSIYQYVVNPESDYWDQYADKSDLESRNLYTSIITMTDQEYARSKFGQTLEPIENSNTHWAWLESRGKL